MLILFNEREWKMELKKERCGVPSLTKALIRTFWLEFCKNGLLCMVEEWLFRHVTTYNNVI